VEFIAIVGSTRVGGISLGKTSGVLVDTGWGIKPNELNRQATSTRPSIKTDRTKRI